MAKLLRRPQSFVSKYENGERRLDLIELIEVADVIHLDLTDIIRQVREIPEQ